MMKTKIKYTVPILMKTIIENTENTILTLQYKNKISAIQLVHL